MSQTGKERSGLCSLRLVAAEVGLRRREVVCLCGGMRWRAREAGLAGFAAACDGLGSWWCAREVGVRDGGGRRWQFKGSSQVSGGH
ncbi:hypothetical protein TIFTF001_020470 [Ficus carica]|uniref:Uncharacterized protein n=1 Tax=Ficus carica TaxID=3494 RepID=A0AA88AEZ0_FICCA|nr:hypothetical protein TIFTF001_020470 [Ficus carica]